MAAWCRGNEGESFLIAFGGPPQQNVVSLLLGDSHLPGTTFLAVLIYQFPPQNEKVPFRAVRRRA